MQRDVNNYVEVPVGDGKPKVKGGALVRGILTNANIDFTKMGLPAWENMSGGAWNINNNAVIVARAIQDYFVKGVDPEETIMASKNILDFQVIAKVGGKYSGCYQMVGEDKVPVQKVNKSVRHGRQKVWNHLQDPRCNRQRTQNYPVCQFTAW